jgi:hypothetical protein
VGDVMTQKFSTFQDFHSRYPLDEITIPVAIQGPDEEGPYWLIQLALPMQYKVINCYIFNATQKDILNYKKRSMAMMKHALQIGPGVL